MDSQLATYDRVAAELGRPSIYSQLEANKLAFVRTKMKGLNDAEVGMALELAASLGLNVWANEFYASKDDRDKIFLMVGRDGLLAKAEEFPDYVGYDCGVVHEQDVFRRLQPTPDALTMRERAGVFHEMGHPKDRGAILGAWAVAERTGRPPRFFYAALSEYNTHKKAWQNHPSVMIEKVAISVVHRTLTKLSGVYLPEEVDRALERDDGTRRILTVEEELERVREVVDEHVPERLRDPLFEMVERANKVSPFSRGLAWAQMVLPGRGERDIEREIRWLGEQFPEDAVPLEGEAVEEIPSADFATADEDLLIEQPDPPEATVAPEELICPICDKAWVDHRVVDREQCERQADAASGA